MIGKVRMKNKCFRLWDTGAGTDEWLPPYKTVYIEDSGLGVETTMVEKPTKRTESPKRVKAVKRVKTAKRLEAIK